MISVQAELEEVLSEDLHAVRHRQSTAFEGMLRPFAGRVVLFGAGSAGRTALENLKSAGIVPLAFADNNRERQGTDIDGVPVLSPEEAANRFGGSALFVVTIYSQGPVFRHTRLQLEQLGVAYIASDSALRWRFPDGLLPFFCHDLPEKVIGAKDRVLAASELWSDDYSRGEFLNQVKWRALGDLGAMNLPVPEESYFPGSIFSLLPNESFVDCGAYTGDTAQRVVELTAGRFQHITAIEADRQNFQQLKTWMETLPPEVSGKISALNIAVGSESGEVSFDPQNTMIAAGGSTTISCHRLDDLLSGQTPTFIKMDIEGAELNALGGARTTLQKKAPVLAVCVYHRQSDLWEIPLTIAAMQPGYRFYLRPHEGDGWQSVVYAVPPERCEAGNS